jgi:hypothetical protein
MFRLIKFVIKTAITIKLMAVAFAAGMGAAYALQLRMQYRTWGLVADAPERGLAGDDLVTPADHIETRRVDIDATPEQVWPWLVQLGYGRGGWYSYPMLDRAWRPGGGEPSSSAESILEEYQDLAEGDLVPTHPEGGFVARVVEPGKALVLYLDDAMVREQFEELVASGADDAEAVPAETDMPPFAVSWAFVLEDAPGDRTRLVERLRVRIEDISEGQRKAMPFLGLGVFTLMRSQMLGIKRRAEEAALADA